jgi:hypothetical protein
MSEQKNGFRYDIETTKNKPLIIQQLEYVRKTPPDAFASNPWFVFPLSNPRQGFVRLFAGVAPTGLNGFFANAPSRRTIAKAVEATSSPHMLTDPKLKALVAKRFYQPKQWLTSSFENAQQEHSRGGFVLAVDLPIDHISKYIELLTVRTNEIVYNVPREIVKQSLVQIAAFGPNSLQYFQSH